ncbi:MAG: AMP-binding protein [Acidimicrobiales bacterium]
MTGHDLWSLVSEHESRHPDRVVLDFAGEEWTWTQLVAAAESCAAGLAAVGVRRDGVVCHFAPNDAEVIVTMLALVRLGAVECPVNAGLRGAQLVHVMKHSEASTIIVDASLADRVADVLDRCPDLRRIVVRGDCELAADARSVSYAAIQGANGTPLEPFTPPDPTQPLCIIYTSGTTGPAKGVVLPHGFPVEQAHIKMQAWGLDHNDVLFTALPLYHVNARFSTLGTALVADARAAILPSFSARSFWSDVKRSGATEIGSVGAVASILLLQEPTAQDRDHRVRMMHGAGSLAPSRRQEFEDRFGLRLVMGFAMTETGHITTTSPDDPNRYTASGRAVPQFDVAIVNGDDEQLPVGSVGELVVRPKRPNAVMTRYHRDPEATVEAWRNLWFHTGDLAFFDKQGYLHWTDRKKDAIRHHGEMISSAELEKIALQYPGVIECAAIGVPGELGDQDIKLVVACDRPHVDLRDLVAFCAHRLPDFAAPRYVELVASLPKGATHKVEKTKLRAEPFSSGTIDTRQPLPE